MQSFKQRRLAWLSVILAFGVVVAACGGDDDDAGADTGTEEDGGESGGASGSINVSGSSTVEPISSLAAEAFMGENDSVDIAVDGPGTGDGFELFCNGETEISDASRAIKDEEIAACEAGGVEYVELQVAYDGMAVMTSVDNDQVECVNFADLYALTGPEAEGIGTWADAAAVAGELGSTTELPDAELALTGPGTESGTYDSFVEIALEGFAEERGQEATTRTDYASSADDNTIIANIEASPTSLGWVGFAFAENAGDTVRSLAVSEEPGGDCVEPSAETISDGSYPLSRPLFIYVNKAKAEENAALAEFVDFYLENLTEFVEEGGYVTMPDDQVEATSTAWSDR
ncbi:MAG TPA: substrate-binding domain-containing protein [Acidimicrobiales bacterium]|nr:substrate-binding domain-containing protein [Acidimicrobiales bacterium]